MPSTSSGTPSPCFGLFVHWRATPGRSSGTPKLFKLSVPRLDPQVACPSDFLELASHAFNTKWHAIVKVPPGVMGWCATPLGSSGTPIVADGVSRPFCVLHCCSLELCTSVPRLVPGVPCPYACLNFSCGI
ncbi:hypothetical protein AHAS_Ahas16G0185300 [Arachis hypogaea]